jgi:hypothetical protein
VHESQTLPPQACDDCGHPTDGRYCSQCGQDQRSRRISVWTLIRDYLGDAFDLDSKLFRTLGQLVARPGLLTAEYLAGRRTRYVKPFRIYLLASVILFVLPSVVPVGLHFKATGPRGGLGSITIARDDGKPLWGMTGPHPRPMDESDKIRRELDAARERSPFLRVLIDRIRALMESEPEEAARRFTRAFGAALQYALFLLVPFLALLLKALYLSSGRFYVEHLIFSFHFSTVQFLICLAAMYSWRSPWLYALEVVALAGYLLLALRRVYGQSMAKTMVKGTVAVGVYGLAFITAATLALLATLWTA